MSHNISLSSHSKNNNEICLHRRVPGPRGRPRRRFGRGGPGPPRQRYHQPLQGTGDAVFLTRYPLSLVSNCTTSLSNGIFRLNKPQCFWHIMEKLEEQIKIPTRLTYRAVGSGTGQKEFLGKVLDPEDVSRHSVVGSFLSQVVSAHRAPTAYPSRTRASRKRPTMTSARATFPSRRPTATPTSLRASSSSSSPSSSRP